MTSHQRRLLQRDRPWEVGALYRAEGITAFGKGEVSSIFNCGARSAGVGGPVLGVCFVFLE